MSQVKQGSRGPTEQRKDERGLREAGEQGKDGQGSRGAGEQGSTNLPSFHPSILPSLLCWLLILAFTIYFSLLSVQQHRAFQTNGLDLGNVDQALWHTAQGNFLHFTLMTPIESRLALHVEPILLLAVPLYWLNLGGPEVLLVIQVVVVAIGAWPLYQIAVRNLSRGAGARGGRGEIANSRLLPRPPAPLLVFPLAYLLLPTLQSAVLFDFHAVTLAATFFLFAFWALEKKKDTYFVVFLLLAMACKEDMPLVAAMLGLYAGLSRRRWRMAGLIIVLSIIWFVVAFFLIQPRFATGGNIQLDRYAWLGDDPSAMLQTVVTQPGFVLNHLWYEADLFNYLVHLFFPTAYLALFSPLTLLPLLPTLAVNLLSDNPFTWRLEDFHYGAPLAPFLFISAIYGIGWLVGRLEGWKAGEKHEPGSRGAEEQGSETLRPSNPQSPNPSTSPFVTLRVRKPLRTSLPISNPQSPLLFALCALLLIFSLVYHFHRGFTPLSRPFTWPAVTAHHQILDSIVQTIPPDAALFTQSNLAPHLTHRATIYTDFGYFTDPEFPAPTPVDDIVLDVTSFENIGGLHQFLREALLEQHDFEVVAAQDGILHWQRIADHGSRITDHGLPTSFYTFSQPTTPPEVELSVDFGDFVRLHGYSLHFNRQEEVQLSLDLEPLQPLPPDLRPVIYLTDARGQLTGATTDLQPGLVWFPPEQWAVGEKVRVRFNTLPWHTRETESYGLALGVVSGDDLWEVSRRHLPMITHPAKFITHLPADGTVIELARIQQIWNIPRGGPSLRRFAVPGLPNQLKANFDNQIQLLGHTAPQITDPQPLIFRRSVQSPNLQPPILFITLYWQALKPPPYLIRFVQLVGPDGLVYGQADSIPDNGLYPTDLWQPGEIVVETIAFPVPPVRPSGDYNLHLGFYDPTTGQRLNLLSGGDHVEINCRAICQIGPE